MKFLQSVQEIYRYILLILLFIQIVITAVTDYSPSHDIIAIYVMLLLGLEILHDMDE